jgi:hypothetical protein
MKECRGQMLLFCLEASPVDGLANPFPWPESKKEKRTTDISGLKCSELSESYARLISSVRTYLESCTLPLTRFVRTWSVRATKSGYSIMKLRLSEQGTGGKDCSLWLSTPVASDAFGARSKRFKTKTPTTVEFVKMWPTPTTRDYKSPDMNPESTRPSQKTELNTAIGGQLNPDWVCWLMGFPPGWVNISE